MNKNLTFLFLAFSMLLVGCQSMMEDIGKDYDVKRELTFVKDFCEPTTLAGSQVGFKAVIDGKRKELESVQGTLEVSKYQKLSQELQTYTAKAELLSGRFNETCRIRALCLFRKKTDGECAGSVEQYEASRKDLNSLLTSLEQFATTK